MDQKGKKKHTGGLVVSEDVIAKIAGVAAKEVKGVAGLVTFPSDIVSLLKRGEAKSVRVEGIDNAMTVEIAICVESDAKLNDVCHNVQKAVKSSIQNMVGRPVARVNVVVADIAASEE